MQCIALLKSLFGQERLFYDSPATKGGVENRGIMAEGEGKTGEIGGESIVLAMGAEADRKLAGVKGRIREFFMIGDCTKPRKIMDAVFEGTKAGCEIQSTTGGTFLDSMWHGSITSWKREFAALAKRYRFPFVILSNWKRIHSLTTAF